MKKYICLYSLETDNCGGKIYTEYGFLYADSFSDAVNQLESYLYGNNIVQINELILYDTVFTVSKDLYEEVKQELEAI